MCIRDSTEGVEEHGHGTDIETMRADPQQMIEDTGDFRIHHANVLRAHRRLDTEQFFDSQHIGVLVAHGRHVIEPIHVTDALVERLALGQLLGSPVQQADVWIGALDYFAIQFQDQTQYAMRGGMLDVYKRQPHKLPNTRNTFQAGRAAPNGLLAPWKLCQIPSALT